MKHKIKRIEELFFGLEGKNKFIKRCEMGLSKSSIIEEIEFIPALVRTLSTNEITIPSNLSFAISAEDIVAIINPLLTLAADPNKILPLLSDLDKELGELLATKDITFDNTDAPEYLIAGNGIFIPGPPPVHYQPKQKEKLLDKLLHKREQKFGINNDADVGRFVGFVDSAESDHFVASGRLFREDLQITRFSSHGKDTHRLFFAALYAAVEKNKINLQISNGDILTFKQLLEILVFVKKTDASQLSLWQTLVDDTQDTIDAVGPYKDRTRFFDPNNYSSSCRSPFVFNSLLICFGEYFGLKNLQGYLLDSHWKETYRMVNRARQVLTNENSLQQLPSNEDLYTFCIESQETNNNAPGSIGGMIESFFTLTPQEACSNPKYVPFSYAYKENVEDNSARTTLHIYHNIFKKNRIENLQRKHYSSFENYMDTLNYPQSSMNALGLSPFTK